MTEKQNKPKSKRRRLVKSAIAVIACLFIFVALLPTLISWGIGQGFVVSAIESNINGKVTIDKLSIGWFSAQEVDGLKINSDDGDTSINASVNLKRGLLPLVFGTTDYGKLYISGDVSGVRYEDGTTSFEKLLKEEDKDEKPEREQKDKDRSGSKNDSNAVTIQIVIDRINLEVLDKSINETAGIKELAGSINLNPAQKTLIDISGKTLAGTTEGSIKVKGTVDSLLKPNGSFNANGASFDIESSIENLPLGVVDAVSGMNNRLVSITGPVLKEAAFTFSGNMKTGDSSVLITTSAVNMKSELSIVNGRLGLKDNQPIIVRADISDDVIKAWFDENMVESLGLSERPILVSGVNNDSATSLEMSINTLDIPLPDDDGIDFNGGSIDIAVVAGSLQFDLPDDGEIKQLAITAFEMHTSSINLTEAINTELKLNARIESDKAAAINAENLNTEFQVQLVKAGSIDSALNIKGVIAAGEGVIEIDESIVGFMDEEGSFAFMNALPVGAIAVRGISPEHISIFMPDLEDITREGLGGNLNLNIETSGNAEVLTVQTTIESPGVNGLLTAKKTSESIELVAAEITAALSPELMKALQKDSDSPVLVTAKAAIIQLEKTVLARHDVDTYVFGEMTVAGTLKIDNALIENGPVVPQPYFASNVDATLSASIGEIVEFEVKGTTILLAKDTSEEFSKLAFGLKQVGEAGESQSVGQLNFTSLAVRKLERVWEKEDGTLANWIGDSGDLFLESTTLEKTSNARIDAAFPYFKGKMGVKQSRTKIEVSLDAPTLTVRKDGLEKLLNPVAEKGEEDAAKQGRIVVASDIPLTIEAKSLILPAALLKGGKLAADSTDLDFTLTAKSPIILKLKGTEKSNPQTVTFSKMNLGLKSSDLTKGVTLAINGMLKATEKVEKGQQTSKSKIEATTTITKLVNEKSKISMKNAAFDMDIAFNDIPTWVLDAFAGRNSFLSDALGESVSAKVSSKAFSANSGRLNATLNSTNNSKVDVRLSGRKGLLRTRKDEPATAALTLNKELRDRVLYKVHPIFADIRSMTNQIRITIKDARFSPENDLTKLDADIFIKTGEIELDPGSQLLGVLQLGKTKNMDTMPGHIGPLDIKIRKGVAKYNDFVIQLGGNHGNYKHRLVFTGDIDLVKQHVNEVIGEYPVADAKKSIDELKFIPGNLTFGMKYSGDLYDRKGNPKPLKSQMIIDFKPEDFFKKGLGDLFDDLRDDGG